MARSLLTRPETSVDARTPARPDFRDRIAQLTGGPALQAISRTPDRIMRLLPGGRTITVDGNTLDPTLQLVLAMQRISGREGLILSDDVATARVRLDASAAAFPRVPVDVTKTDVSVPGPDGNIPAVHIRAPGDAEAPLLIFFHGGGFVVGSWETHGHLCELICQRAGVQVLFVEYRRAPEHPAPAAADDAYAAYLWARDHAAELGADPQRVAVGGDSAGGNLAAVVALRARDDGVPPPVLQLLLYPITNFTNQTRSYSLFADGYFLRRRDMDFCHGKYLGESAVDPADPGVSPLLADDLSGLAPALIVTAGFDPLRDEGRQYAEALRAAGNSVDAREYGSMIHAFANFSTLGGGSATAIADIFSALRGHLRRS